MPCCAAAAGWRGRAQPGRTSIPVRPGSHYFSVEARGPLYERMLKAQSMMIYVPAGIQDLKLELIAVAP